MTHFILLAAGMGSRMAHLTLDKPKALVEVGSGAPIIAHSIESIKACSAGANITVIGGYMSDRLQAYVLATADPSNVGVIVNPAYATEGPLGSIHVGLRSLESLPKSLAIANGDTIFSPGAVQALVGLVHPGVTLLVSKELNPQPDDMIVSVDSDGAVVSAGKQMSPIGSAMISAGCVLFQGSDAISALQHAVDLGRAEELATGKPTAWHSIFSNLYARGLGAQTLQIPRTWWQEFDSPACIETFSRTLRKIERAKVRRMRALKQLAPSSSSAEDAIYAALLGFDNEGAKAALAAAQLPESRKQSLASGIALTEQFPGFPKKIRNQEASTAVSGRWSLTRREKNYIIRGVVHAPVNHVYIVADCIVLRIVNTKLEQTAYGANTTFRFKMWPSLLKGLNPDARIAVTSDAGPLLGESGALHTDIQNTRGRGWIASRLKRGYIVTKKGSLKKQLTKRTLWGDGIMNAFESFSEYFNRTFEYRPFLIYGTLLGCMRERNFLAGDDDFDAAYFSRETTPEGVKREMIGILKRMSIDGYKFELSAKAGFFKPKVDGFSFDLFPAWIGNGNLWMHNTTCIPTDRSMIEPIGTTDFRDRIVHVPAQPAAFLQAKYGDWRNPDPGYQPRAAAGTDAYLARARLTPEERESLRATSALEKNAV